MPLLSSQQQTKEQAFELCQCTVFVIPPFSLPKAGHLGSHCLISLCPCARWRLVIDWQDVPLGRVQVLAASGFWRQEAGRALGQVMVKQAEKSMAQPGKCHL